MYDDAPGYFEITLNTKTDGDGALTLSARYETCQEPSTDNTYAVIGKPFYDSVREWTKTYLLIGALQDITSDPPQDPPCPDAAVFDIRGWVQDSGSGSANITYTSTKVLAMYQRESMLCGKSCCSCGRWKATDRPGIPAKSG